MASLDDLVPDVLFLMLIRAPSVQVLWGFIRASPRMYAVFRDQRDSILSAVITREIGPGILCEARAALRSSQLEPRGLGIDQALEWVEAYGAEINRGRTMQDPALGLDTVPLWRQHQDLKFMADLYFREKLPFSTLCLTKVVMRMRLYRSIYRFVVYGNLFYFDEKRNEKKPKSSRTLFIGAYDQSHIFLSLFSAWEIEELSCINDFIHDKIAEKWQEVEDNFYDAVAIDPSSWDVHRPLHESRWDSDIFFSRSLKTWHGHWQAYFAVLRLSDLKEVFAAKDADLERVVQYHAGHLAHDSLEAALDEEPYHSVFSTPEFEEHQQAIASGIKIQFEKDDIDRPNEAWIWAHNFKPCDLYVEARCDFEVGEGLRRIGYVFWDSSRLHDSGLLSESPSEVATLTMERFPRPKLREQSVEERIRELALSRENTDH
ncbi:hypothetical protein V8E51_015747 [Hyaloscypha variabilis]